MRSENAKFTGGILRSGVTWGWHMHDDLTCFSGSRLNCLDFNVTNTAKIVVSLTGNFIVTDDDEHKRHAHVVVGKNDGTAHAGHLLKGDVWPTLKVILIESPEN